MCIRDSDNIFPEYYTLNWVPDNIPKVSYATSFGVAQLDRCYKSKARFFLNRLSAISVRESSGCDLVKELTGKIPYIVCDPVFLLTKNQWTDVYKRQLFMLVVQHLIRTI